MANFDGIGTCISEEFNAFGAGDIACYEGKICELLAKHTDGISYALGKTVRGRDGHSVNAFFYEFADMPEDAVTVQFAVGSTVGGDSRATH